MKGDKRLSLLLQMERDWHRQKDWYDACVCNHEHAVHVSWITRRAKKRQAQ